MLTRILTGLVCAQLAFAPTLARASDSCAADAMIVFDGSGSMAEMGFNNLDRPRIFDAREAVQKAMPFIAPFRRVGLIIYGPGPRDDHGSSCGNIDLRFAPEPDVGARVIREIDNLQPDGETPLTAAVADAAEVLQFRDRPGMVVLVTDGKETCGGSPCNLAGELAAQAANLTVHVIGFKVRASQFTWNEKEGGQSTVAECLAVMNQGRYVPAESVEDLASALEETLGCAYLSRNGLDRVRRI